jgi:hypothetical protein
MTNAEAHQDDIFTRWVNASFSVSRAIKDPLGSHLMFQIQALGRLDAKLRPLDAHFGGMVAHPPEASDAVGVALAFTDFLDQSRLWVLGAYELVRTLDECIRHSLWRPPEGVRDDVRVAKRALARVRIPLAKFQAAGRARSALPGDLLPQPVLATGVGCAWAVGPTADDIVTRLGLSDAVLDLFERARREDPRFATQSAPP